jgi:hypothetical protein
MSLLPLGLLSQGGGAAAGSYELISTTLLGGNQSSVTFSSIVSTYSHLQIRMSVKSDRAFAFDNMQMRFNSDSGSNYASHWLYSNNSTIVPDYESSTNRIIVARVPDAAANANEFGASVIDIADYKSTTKNKVIKSLYGSNTSTSYPYSGMHTGAWFSTAAITSITLLPVSGTNFTANSRFSLYGIKGS